MRAGSALQHRLFGLSIHGYESVGACRRRRRLEFDEKLERWSLKRIQNPLLTNFDTCTYLPVRRPGFRKPARKPGHPKLLVLLSCWGSSAVDGRYLQKDPKKAYPNDSIVTSPKTTQMRQKEIRSPEDRIQPTCTRSNPSNLTSPEGPVT